MDVCVVSDADPPDAAEAEPELPAGEEARNPRQFRRDNGGSRRHGKNRKRDRRPRRDQRDRRNGRFDEDDE